jgi:hypothetical protein
MQMCGIREAEMTAVELFEDSHNRMRLRNKLSNALMAIALSEAKSRSENLSKYIDDGLDISTQFVSSLDDIANNYSDYKYRDYVSKVLLDILTNRLTQQPDKDRLTTYKKEFSAARQVFEAVQQGKEPDQEMMKMANRVIREVDQQIESVYASEESSYRGSFTPK